MPYVIKLKKDAKPPWYHYATKEEALEYFPDDICDAAGFKLSDGGLAIRKLGHGAMSTGCPWVVVWESGRKCSPQAKTRAAQALAKFL